MEMEGFEIFSKFDMSYYNPWYFMNFYWSCWSLMSRNTKDKVQLLWQ